MKSDFSKILFVIIIIGFTSCSPMASPTPTLEPTQTTTSTPQPSPTHKPTSTPDLHATQQATQITALAIEELEAQIAQEVTATAREESVQATAQAEALKQEEEIRQLNEFNQLNEGIFLTDKEYKNESAIGSIIFTKKIMGSKARGWVFPNYVLENTLHQVNGFIIANLSLANIDSRYDKYKGIDRESDRYLKGNEYTEISKNELAQAPIKAKFCNEDQCVEGEYSRINILFSTYTQTDAIRANALASGISTINGINESEIDKAYSMDNTFVFIANNTLHIVGGSLLQPIYRGSKYDSDKPFEYLGYSTPGDDLFISYSNLINFIIRSAAYTAYPANLQNKIKDGIGDDKKWSEVSGFLTFKSGLFTFCDPGDNIFFSRDCKNITEEIITK